MNKTRITYRLHKSLLQEIAIYMSHEGYNLKEKSKWVSEAIETLLSIPDYPDLVKLNAEMHSFEKSDYVTIDKNLKNKLDESALTVKKQYPHLEGVLSLIIRTAIMQRML